MRPIDLESRLVAGGILKSYTIAFSVRSGSTVLSNVLASLGCGNPTEYFQYPYETSLHFQNYSQLRGIEPIYSLVSEYNRGGIFGSKMTHDHRAHLEGVLSQHFGKNCTLADFFPDHKWIYIRRHDVIAQAISLHVAQLSNQWHVPPNDEAVEQIETHYDYFSILSKMMVLSANDANWEAYFAKHEIQPHRIVFEDLVQDVSAGLSKLFNFLKFSGIAAGVELEKEGGLKPISRLKRPVYESLRSRFLEDFIKIGQADDHVRLGPSLEKWNRFFFESQWRV